MAEEAARYVLEGARLEGALDLRSEGDVEAFLEEVADPPRRLELAAGLAEVLRDLGLPERGDDARAAARGALQDLCAGPPAEGELDGDGCSEAVARVAMLDARRVARGDATPTLWAEEIVAAVWACHEGDAPMTIMTDLWLSATQENGLQWSFRLIRGKGEAEAHPMARCLQRAKPGRLPIPEGAKFTLSVRRFR